MERVEEIIDLGSLDERFYAIVGRGDENLKLFSQLFGVKVLARGTEILIRGNEENVRNISKFLKDVLKEFANGPLSTEEVRERAKAFLKGNTEGISPDAEEVVLITYRKKAIVPKTENQRIYVKAIREKDVVFGIGPAGTGKTYLAVAMALALMKENKISKIILTRPAVEAGEKLGYLPGTIAEKVDPYLRPLYDALYDMVGYDKTAYMLGKSIIEIAPLAFMRGRTLNDAFIILDEAQNSTREQMKMFLTRIGFGSKVVITGDITQIDLPKKEESGLLEAIKILKGIEEIGFVQFGQEDVVRHPIVARIIRAYEEYERKQGSGEEKDKRSRKKSSEQNSP